MSNTVKGIIGLCAIVFIFFYFYTIKKATHKPSVSSDEKELNADEVLPEVKVNKSESGDFITKGNWTVFKFKNHPRWLFDIGLVPEILDRFEKEHPKLCVQKGDWQIVYNPMNSSPYGILFRHYPTN